MSQTSPANTPRIVLQLSDRAEGLAVTVLDAPFGAGMAAEIVLQRIEDVLRMASQPTFREDVGRGLFRALFPGKLEDVYRAALAETTVRGLTLDLELRFDRDLARIARYPWELLHDGTRFPVQSGAVALTRTLPCPEPPPPLASAAPLEALYVAAHPSDWPPLAAQYHDLAGALAGPLNAGTLDLAYLLPATWDALMDWLLAGAPHVLHYEGHTALTRTGRFVFEDRRGVFDPVDADIVGAALAGSALRLVALSAATQTPAAGEGLPAGAAPWLVLAGVPAVVAVQGALPPDAALTFWRTFYAALLAGGPVGAAVDAGRRALRRTVYWYVPALFARAAEPLAGPGGALDLRVDTAAPRAAPVGYPLRVAVWLHEAGAPPPSAEAVRRLVGAAVTPAGDEEGAVAPVNCRAETAGRLSAGAVEVRLAAEGCTVHTGRASVTLMAGIAPPPLWFALTPLRAGLVALRLTITQAGAPPVTVTHPLEVLSGEGAPSEVLLLAHHWPDAAVPLDRGVLPPGAPEMVDEFAPPAGAEGEGLQVTGAAPPPTVKEPAAPNEALDDALDDVLAWLRTGEPTAPLMPWLDDQPASQAAPTHWLDDQPVSESSAPQMPEQPPIAAPTPQPEAPRQRRRIAGLSPRDFALLILVLVVIWVIIAVVALALI
ncbi:MAG: CHAT domain-containing protein [Chloroflexota bacterium]